MKYDDFSSYHPVVNFGYFLCVITITMFNMHPVFLGIAVVASIVYSVYLKGRSAWKFNIFMAIPALLIMALINPMFNHHGETILLYVNNNPITLESIIYGIVTAAMFVAVILWFSCYNSVMTSDKFIYLFGRVIPALSLIFSMTLRFVPKFKAQIKVIANAQKCIGQDPATGNVWQRAKKGMRIISIMTTWALENAIETADSMKARGYGLKGRTAFSIFRFEKRDSIVLLTMLICVCAVCIGLLTETVYSLYMVRILINKTTFASVLVYIAYAVLCFLPVGLNVMEDIRWNYLKSKI